MREEVEAFLADRRKYLPASSAWVEINRSTERRMRLPIATAAGIETAFEIDVIVVPDALEPCVRIVLLCGRAVWRLCMSNERHPNQINRPFDLPAAVVGPHQHTWPDNRRFGHPNSLPKNLKNARPLPESIATDDDAFAFFLDQIGIVPPTWGPVKWPSRTRLL